MLETLREWGYLISAVGFIMALRGLSSPATALRGSEWGIGAMALAVMATLTIPAFSFSTYLAIALCLGVGGLVGTRIAQKLPMTALPQLMAAFHSLVGLAAVCVAACALYDPVLFHIANIMGKGIRTGSLVEMALGNVIGAITLTGSLVAFGKLQGVLSGKSLLLPQRHQINVMLGLALVVLLGAFILTASPKFFWLMTLISMALGVLLIIPIGGADMPVVVSMLNSYSGWAAAGIGFTLGNTLLIITGALVGSSGAILSYIMCKGMNRSIISVILGGFGADESLAVADGGGESRPVQLSSPEDAAFLLAQASRVIIVPGYGMAVAQAQHPLKEITNQLKAKDIQVRFAIHPVAGRMPGHMNVLLAEANISYDDVLELEEINADFALTDVVLVVGANDITNPAAENNPQSPLYGMPILDVQKARTVLFVKRSLASGYAGVDNDLFYQSQTYMLLGDAKKVCEEVAKDLKSVG